MGKKEKYFINQKVRDLKNHPPNEKSFELKLFYYIKNGEVYFWCLQSTLWSWIKNNDGWDESLSSGNMENDEIFILDFSDGSNK